MAKAKKTSSPKKTAPTSTSGISPIDTSSAAEAAAKAIANKNLLNATQSEHKNSSAFKQLKDNLAQPHTQQLNSFLNSTSGAQQKSANPFGPNKQVGHNQTFGADVNRRNIPRRTSGG